MNACNSVEWMRRAIADRFPEESKAVDAEMLDYPKDAHESWLERFCDTTNQAMALRDECKVQAHLAFMSQQLADGDDEVRRVIDVGYAENMMSLLDAETKRWAWPLVPRNLKQLYLDLWGEPKELRS